MVTVKVGSKNCKSRVPDLLWKLLLLTEIPSSLLTAPFDMVLSGTSEEKIVTQLMHVAVPL